MSTTQSDPEPDYDSPSWPLTAPDGAACECCGYEDPVGGVHRWDRSPPHHRDDSPYVYLCRLCAGTLTSNAWQSPHHYPVGLALLLQTLVHCTNALIDHQYAESSALAQHLDHLVTTFQRKDS